MKLTLEDLGEIVKGVIKGLEDVDQKKGVSGYEIDDEDVVEPLGYAKSCGHHFHHTSEEGNLYKRQGQSNLGPYTSEGTVRENFNAKPVPKKKLESSAPFTQARVNVGRPGSVGNVKMSEWKSSRTNASIWEELGHWYGTGVSEKKSRKRKKYESNIMQGVYGSRMSEGKVIREKETGFKKLSKSLSDANILNEGKRK